MRIHAIVALLILAACSPKPASTIEEKNIRLVETSLLPPVRIEGDSLWTIEERMAHYGVPGVSIAVIYDNKIVWSKAYGVMNKERKEPVTTQTLFQAGSISKPVAAYGALRIAASGKINADENVNVYLKSWKLPENEFTQKQPVTLKHLLSHTGGVTVHGFLGYSPDLPVPTLIQILNGEPPANSPAIRVDKLPGEGFRYSGGGYTIMQQMLIDVEGKPFPQILQEQVLGPLGMTNSTFEQPLSADKLPLAATGYVPDGTMTKGERHTYPEMAAAGLWTTAEDLARYAVDVQLAYQGKSDKILSREKVTEMLTPFIDEQRGLGPGLDRIKEDFYFGHGGWDEGFSSDLVAHRDKGYGVVVLTNANQPPFISELIRSVALTYNWSNYVDRYTPIPVTQEDILRVSGRYLIDSDGVALVYAKDGKLYYDHTAANPMELFKVSDTTFARRERTALIQFMTNPADGKVHLVYRVNPDDSVRYEHPLMEEGAKVPYEWFLEGDYDRARKEYTAFLKKNANDGFINQRAINGKGYDLLFQNKIKEAKALFKINMELFPTSADVYDSYAEACMKNGDNEEAITYYRKTLEMNPDNPGAKRNLEELEKNK
jgi:CubicO group peptidase (beta-lactamase class C family)